MQGAENKAVELKEPLNVLKHQAAFAKESAYVQTEKQEVLKSE